MYQNKKSYIYRAIEFAPIWIVLTFGRILPFWVRAKMFAFLGGIIVTHFPKARKRVHKGLRICLLYTSPSPRDRQKSRMPSSA